MNLLIIPFHDWRKSQREGFRTRDAHFIKALSKIDAVDKIIIVNRPTTHLELLYNNQKTIIQGEIILKKGRFSLYKTDHKIFVIDFLSLDIFSQVKKKTFVVY
ncbi:hypothetical protein [Lutibacter sp.]|uniref:hypothetical protein n=1 Tax=Lutibacter sp. TaxID=1925666 RepID=UPI0034A097CE